MQGVVYGINIPQMKNDSLCTRFDVDECFGTVINRFCAQAIVGMPLTVYGAGGQTRGYLPLRESMKCLTIAIDNPPSAGEYRTFNQFGQVYSVNTLAAAVASAARTLSINVAIMPVDNPRIESEQHGYTPDCAALRTLGYVPTDTLDFDLVDMLGTLEPLQDRIETIRDVLVPRTQWNQRKPVVVR